MEIPVLCYASDLNSPLIKVPSMVKDALCPEFASALGLRKLPTARFWNTINNGREIAGVAFARSPETVELHHRATMLRLGPWDIRQTFIHEVAHHIDRSLRGFTRHDQYFAAAVLVMVSRVPLVKLGFALGENGGLRDLSRHAGLMRFVTELFLDADPRYVEEQWQYLTYIVDDWAYHGDSGFTEDAIEGLFNHLTRSTL